MLAAPVGMTILCLASEHRICSSVLSILTLGTVLGGRQDREDGWPKIGRDASFGQKGAALVFRGTFQRQNL